MPRDDISKLHAEVDRWIRNSDLTKSNVVVVPSLSTSFRERTAYALRERFDSNGIHLYAHHLSIDKLTQSVTGRRSRSFRMLLDRERLVFLHDVDAVKSVRRFGARLRAEADATTRSKVVLFIRPAQARQLYADRRAPLYGRVVKLVEPTLEKLGFTSKESKRAGYSDLFISFSLDEYDDSVLSQATSRTFVFLNLFWNYLLNDSGRIGSTYVVASCIASHDAPLTISAINDKIGISYVRPVLQRATTTGPIRLTEDRPSRAYVYPPLLSEWVARNKPFYGRPK